MTEFKTMTIKTISEAPAKIECEIIREETHGFDNPGGGWSLYPHDRDTPAKFVIFRQKRKRKTQRINKKQVISIE